MADCLIFRVTYHLNGNTLETFVRTFPDFRSMKGFADRVMGSDQMELVACSVYSEKHHFSYSDTITKGYDPEWERMYTTPGFRLIKNPHK